MSDIDLPDLEHLALEELTQIQGRIEDAIRQRRNEARQRALNEIRRLTREHDLKPSEVRRAAEAGTKPKKAPALYRNPDNPRQTWSGKGKPPDWFMATEDPETLRIPGT
jgi:DNA-binding protein H-NS